MTSLLCGLSLLVDVVREGYLDGIGGQARHRESGRRRRMAERSVMEGATGRGIERRLIL